MLNPRWRLPAIGRREIELARCSMPRVAPLILDSVFYLFEREPKEGEIVPPDGTGFIVGRTSAAGGGDTHYYAVTNWHLACQGSSVLRLNQRAGGSRYVETEPAEWQFFPGADDLAILDITDQVNVNDDEIACLLESMFVTKEIAREFLIGSGADTFMCGLFYSHPGPTERNVPAFRFGNISMMPNDQALLDMETDGRCAAYLVDTHSRSGFSGSPVFVYQTYGADLSTFPMDWRRTERDHVMLAGGPTDRYVGLLGVHCGQFWDDVKFRKPERAESERIGDVIREGETLEIQGSMTIVVPAWRITDLLDSEIFEMARQKRDDDRAERRARRPRPEAVRKDSTTDANPTHREDFNSLLGAAAQKREQED